MTANGQNGSTELTPLLSGEPQEEESSNNATANDSRQPLYDFLEAKSPGGKTYETLIIVLIILNVLSFVFASLFVEEYNPEDWAKRDGGICGSLCDALWFGNYRDNGLQRLQLGATSILELVTIAVFSVEYVLRLHTCDLEGAQFKGVVGRFKYMITFFSLVDLASTVPFYIDALVFRDTDMAGSAFLRMFRLLRMMKVEGRYDTALTMVDDVYRAQKAILGTALFVGLTTWLTVASLYYLVERRSLDMIYCGAAPHCDEDEIDTSLCTIDDWGFADCTKAGCPPTDDLLEPCYNLFQSIPMSSYYTLLNLFGEFPLIDQHSFGGMIVGTITAVVAVAVFALPAGIIGNGFEDEIEKRRNAEEEAPIVEDGGRTEGFVGNSETTRGRLYNFLFALSVPYSVAFDYFVSAMVVGTALTFMVDSLAYLPLSLRYFNDYFELAAVLVFTAEYVSKAYCCQEDPKFAHSAGLWRYSVGFLPVVDLLSVLPYWIEVAVTGTVFSLTGSSFLGNLVKSFRLLRILRFEKYTHAFTSFDDVFSRNKDVLSVTLFTAILFWVFFGAFLYITERDNPDAEMAANYNNVPNAMWMTLLNLAGEAPLCQYSAWGKVATGILGLFATGVFGIPIGILGAGFEQVLEEENEDNTEELQEEVARSSQESDLGSSFEQTCYKFVNGIGSYAARFFETCIYILIFTAVIVGVIQTVDGREDDFATVEWFAVIVFTAEYVIRFVGAGADPEFASGGAGAVSSRLRFIFSFYSIIDLLAIVPFYITIALPGSIVNEYDEYLRMLRIMRLVKLDKYIPSITLIDDVIRLKYNALKVAFFAAITLWILFAALLYLFEVDDVDNGLDDPVPTYGCVEDCTMADRFQNFFDSMVYTGVHLTGDYPITTYNWPSRFVNFFMVIAAVGVVSIPSALIASGFVEIVQSKNKAKQARAGAAPPPPSGGVAGDDWYEVAYRGLEGTEPPPSRFGPKVDAWQIAVNEFLNGKEDETGATHYTFWSYSGRIFIFTIIITNVIAVLLESVPSIDKSVGNQPGNFFDIFEMLSVMVFATEYISRLFCAPKNREALYSTLIYATTFFGIVDFLSTAPWFVQQALIAFKVISYGDDKARIFRIFRIFRILQLEDFVTAFSKLDNVFRASKDILKATGLMALIIWVGCGALFYIFEENNPNWRSCDDSVPVTGNSTEAPGCFDFASTAECNAYYPGLCEQKVFTNMPNSLYLTAVFLGGEWGVIDFTWPGRLVCLFLCVVGIGLYAIPIGALFDSFGAVLGMGGDDDEEEEEGQEA
mmetsp:Transcript_130029/g.193603  ORF Transcript_130029/g.193603 Transcript_130029/m.193603 type:complete len:1282 (-) Transcript_130029:195-4040(-)|eukprot:CAMPEP_0117048584 /NCGR_PEP_ID=MMETSP0472-20121206/33582_1 /TAXON_ID=693140 ORGANISM="Tiarina fusus, Strain LIS" /NCGR_SAMPLE_ID=MMETSP0472 /ASSEMBLY_ACC=CAM_ASM_000603 /LENGTH=1281 /DNA_ID=CAMNT_0004761735 /DNA_START=199 /DNA_END=4044 /DNA_ORIENTATION=-